MDNLNQLPPLPTAGKANPTKRSGWVDRSVPRNHPFSNTGGKLDNREKAIIDWLGVSFVLPEGLEYPTDKAEAISPAVKSVLFDLVSDLFHFTEIEPTGGGWSGYLHKFKIGPKGEWGWISFGGANQKRTVNIQVTGTGCAHIRDWAGIIFWGRGFDLHQGIDPKSIKITRLDIAHDDVEAENVSVAIAKEWYETGKFINNGRCPTSCLFDDMGSNKGKTFYVGKRENGKLLRVYEKGKQLGDENSPWVRAEVEFRCKDRVIPWDALERPGEYLAGSYPPLAFISEVKAVLSTVRKASQITYNKMIQWLNRQAGQAIFAAAQINGGDISAVFEKVARSTWPPRLRKYQQLMGLDIEQMARC